MECKVPSLQSAVGSVGMNITETSPLEVHYGFTLDGVMTLKNISHDSNFGPMLLYPDPHLIIFPGDEQTKQFTDKDLLVINVGGNKYIEQNSYVKDLHFTAEEMHWLEQNSYVKDLHFTAEEMHWLEQNSYVKDLYFTAEEMHWLEQNSYVKDLHFTAKEMHWLEQNSYVKDLHFTAKEMHWLEQNSYVKDLYFTTKEVHWLVIYTWGWTDQTVHWQGPAGHQQRWN